MQFMYATRVGNRLYVCLIMYTKMGTRHIAMRISPKHFPDTVYIITPYVSFDLETMST